MSGALANVKSLTPANWQPSEHRIAIVEQVVGASA